MPAAPAADTNFWHCDVEPTHAHASRLNEASCSSKASEYEAPRTDKSDLKVRNMKGRGRLDMLPLHFKRFDMSLACGIAMKAANVGR